ncbi:MAG: CPBP family intramembrane metalloprotease [Oscillospiraceae bacterium]|jgi:membrane protease YdiL (CAAX protease family)|nr:CPBP family intramembrane metalloprotease [Oscillospiraceae bacterium]
MKHKSAIFITVFSVSACALHTLMLHTQFSNYTLTSIAKIILFVFFPLIYIKILKERRFKDLFSLKGNSKNTKISLALGFGVFAVIWIAFLILRPFIEKEMIIGALDNNGITRNNFFLVFIYVVLINAALEELFFRGYIFDTLYKMNYKRYAHLYSGLLFAVYHVAILREALSPGMMIFCIAGLVVAGLIFNLLVVWCKCITGSLIVHISANLALNLIILYYLLT